MRKVISYALFGDCFTGVGRENYAQFAKSVIMANLTLFPRSEGWAVRIHHDGRIADRVYGREMMALAENGLIDLVEMQPAPLCKAMIWRMAPIFDANVDVVFSRDMDSLPSPRDRACCEIFLASDAAVHTIHDNKFHDGIMGGLSGFKTEPFRAMGMRSFDDLFSFGGINWEKHGADQDLLNRHVATRLPVYEHFCDRRNYQVAYSEPVLRVGAGPLTPDLLAQADLLAPHMGSMGFDTEAAVAFYRTHGSENSRSCP